MLQWHWLAAELITLKWNQELWNQLIQVAIHKTSYEHLKIRIVVFFYSLLFIHDFRLSLHLPYYSQL
jgi:hypothetical protein